MDAELEKLLTSNRPAGEEQGSFTVKLHDDLQTVEVDGPDGPTRHPLKPLAELYGTGTNAAAVDPQDDRFTPLLMGIETAILNFENDRRDLTDGEVLLALNRLGLNPEADELARFIQTDLRLLLSLNDFSRQDVRGSLRKIAKSVQRHTRLAGPRGYLDFIHEVLDRV